MRNCCRASEETLTPTGELLESVFQNAEMGRDILARLIRVCDDHEFRGVMATEFIEYQEVITDVVHTMGRLGCVPQSNRLARSMSFSGIRLNTLVNRSVTHLAEMLIQGSTMGIIDTRRALNTYRDAAQEVKDLASRLIETERANVDGLMRFL